MNQNMELRNLPDRDSYERMSTGELRARFVLDTLFVPGKVSMVHCEVDRAIVGGVVPPARPLKLSAPRAVMAAEFFTERRELGIVNIGEDGVVHAGGKEIAVRHKDMLYIGKGVRDIAFTSARRGRPAAFYFVSFPAHAPYPIALVRREDAEKNPIGSTQFANKRTIHKYIHPGGADSCQLVMGLTDLEQGSVWNTMPPHTHSRRSEVYLYFGSSPDAVIVHLMGTPGHTRSLMLRNRQAVISPGWSIHSAVGTEAYSFVWAMGGENKEFTDMDAVRIQDLR